MFSSALLETAQLSARRRATDGKYEQRPHPSPQKAHQSLVLSQSSRVPPIGNDETDDQPANRTEAHDRRISLGDDRIGKTKEKTKDQPCKPSGKRKSRCPD